jgi:drug/metabolite transporter (DMT)-like permease
MVRLEYTPLLYGLLMAGIDVFMLGTIKTVSSAPTKLIRWMAIPTLIYALQPWIFLSSLKYESLIVMNLMWDLISDILVTFVGLVYFREKLGPYKTLGVILSFVSITLLSLQDGNWEDFLPSIQNGKA